MLFPSIPKIFGNTKPTARPPNEKREDIDVMNILSLGEYQSLLRLTIEFSTISIPPPIRNIPKMTNQKEYPIRVLIHTPPTVNRQARQIGILVPYVWIKKLEGKFPMI